MKGSFSSWLGGRESIGLRMGRTKVEKVKASASDGNTISAVRKALPTVASKADDKPEPMSADMVEALRADATREEPHIACCNSDTVLRLLATLDKTVEDGRQEHNSLRRDLCRAGAKGTDDSAEQVAEAMDWHDLDWDLHGS